MGHKQARSKPSSAKVPEDIRKSKNQKDPEPVSSDEDEDDSEEEAEEPPPPPKKKKVKINAPGDTDRRSREPNNDLPYINVPAVKPAPKNWKPRQPGSNADIIPIINKGAAYRTRAPVQTEKGDNDVVSRIMNSPVTVTTRDLLDISPGVREQVKKNVTKRRIKEIEAEVADAFARLEQQELQNYDDLYDDEDAEVYLSVNAINIDSLPDAGHFITTEARGNVPAGSVVCDDPVLMFLNDYQGDDPPELFVAKESDSLRTIHPVINGNGTRECVLDGGSQIVSIDRDVALSLGISWDPDVKIFMQSANKSVEKTEGLARNVPFLFNDITIYLQVHVIRNPAYDVLLGRPFDTLTKSQVHNTTDGGQIVTITDPNTGRRCTLPTHPKSKAKTILKKKVEENFRSSMN